MVQFRSHPLAGHPVPDQGPPLCDVAFLAMTARISGHGDPERAGIRVFYLDTRRPRKLERQGSLGGKIPDMDQIRALSDDATSIRCKLRTVNRSTVL